MMPSAMDQQSNVCTALYVHSVNVCMSLCMYVGGWELMCSVQYDCTCDLFMSLV